MKDISNLVELVLWLILNNVNVFATLSQGQALNVDICWEVLCFKGILCEILSLRQVSNLLIQLT